MKWLEKIAQEAYEEELNNIYENPEEYEPETYEEEDAYNPLIPLVSGGLTGSALMTGLGAIGNKFSGLPASRGLSRNAIIGGLLGLSGVGIPMLINKLRSSNNAFEPMNENIAAEPLESVVFGE